MKFNDLYQLMTETFNDDSEVIGEAHSGHGDERKIKDAIKEAIKKRLIKPFPKDTKKGWMLQSLVDNSQHLTHKGEPGYHDLRRYLEGLERVLKVSR
jgi:hypothetical protein